MRIGTPILVLFTFFVNAQRSDFQLVEFKEADSIAKVYNGESLENLPVLTHKLTTDLPTQVEKFRAIYTWVSTNIENDYGAYLTTRKKRKKLAKNRAAFLEWNSSFTPKVFERLIKDKKTACTGYAYLIREMATLAGFNCRIVNGFGRTPNLQLNSESTPNHSWNSIEIDGKWYLCDATWSAGRVMLGESGPQFETDYFDGYFLADPKLFVKNHYPVEVKSTFLSNPPGFEQFIEGPVIYKEAFNAPIVPVSPKKMRLEVMKNKTISFNLQVPNEFKKENVHLILNNGGNDRKIIPTVRLNQNECILEYIFEKTGLYDVHIQIEEVLIATYVLKVKRK